MQLPYLLPCSPLVLCDDRFSLTESTSSEVPFWEVLQAVFATPTLDIASLIDKLETITLCLRGSSSNDYGYLRVFLSKELSDDFFISTWPALEKLALSMPKLFTVHEIPVLSLEAPEISMSREQIACLVVHQFLCTLPLAPWHDDPSSEPFVDFHIWYGSEQPHHKVVYAYLKALFEYFSRMASPMQSPLKDQDLDWPISFTLQHTTEPLPNGKMVSLEIVELETASTAPTLLGIPSGAAVISANRYIGFGRTGTQEETHVGASPESCTAVLFTPPLANSHVVIMQGAEAMITIEGYGRTAFCAEVLKPCSSPQQSPIKQRTMLFMDALELDLVEAEAGEVPDLRPGNVLRDRNKAYTAVASKAALIAGDANSDGLRYSSVYTGMWGCGTFGGNKEIKAVIQWCAASRAGVPLMFICGGREQLEFGAHLKDFVHGILSLEVSAGEVEDALLAIDPKSTAAQRVFLSILDALS